MTVYDTVAETILEKTPRTIRTEKDRIEYDIVEETVVEKSPTTQTEQFARQVTTLNPRRVYKDVDVEVEVQVPRTVTTPVERTVTDFTPRIEVEQVESTRLKPVTEHGIAYVPTYGGSYYGSRLGRGYSGYGSGTSSYGHGW